MASIVEYIESFDFNELGRDTRLPSGLSLDEALILARIHAIGLSEILADITAVAPPDGPASHWAARLNGGLPRLKLVGGSADATSRFP